MHRKGVVIKCVRTCLLTTKVVPSVLIGQVQNNDFEIYLRIRVQDDFPYVNTESQKV